MGAAYKKFDYTEQPVNCLNISIMFIILTAGTSALRPKTWQLDGLTMEVLILSNFFIFTHKYYFAKYDHVISSAKRVVKYGCNGVYTLAKTET